MMPIKGLSADEAELHRRPLVGKGGNYLSAVLLCMWDNIHGPKILSVWNRDQDSNSPIVSGRHTHPPSPLPKSATLLSVAIHSLNNEPGRTERIQGIEPKFFVMEKHSIIAGAFVFTVEINQGRSEVFSFILVLPHSEMEEYLDRFSFLENKVCQILQRGLIEPLLKAPQPGGLVYKSQARLKQQVMKEVVNMDMPIQNMANLMHSLRYNCIPHNYTIHQTFLGNELEGMRKFLEYSITCHLQCSGHAIVVGEDRQAVNTMLRTLGMFLSDQEKKLSRLASSPPSSRDSDDNVDFFNYEPNLYLQGFVLNGESSSYLPFSMFKLRESYLPPCIIHISNSCREVRWVEMNIPYFIRVKEDNEKKSKKRLSANSSFYVPFPLTPPIHLHPPPPPPSSLPSLPIMSDSLDFRDLHQFKDFKEYTSRMVTDFIERMRLLPVTDGVREGFIFQFLHHLKLKALALSKYMDADHKMNTGEQIVGVLALGRGGVVDKARVHRDTLQQDLSLDCDGDLHVVLAFAEKIRPNTYIDVLGDPHSHSEAVIREFEAL